MSRTGPGHVHADWPAFTPEARCSGCGHRIARRFGDPDPRPTRRAGWRMILAELPMRLVATSYFKINPNDRPPA